MKVTDFKRLRNCETNLQEWVSARILKSPRKSTTDRIQEKPMIQVEMINEDGRATWRAADFQAESGKGQCKWSHRSQRPRAWQKSVKGDSRARKETRNIWNPFDRSSERKNTSCEVLSSLSLEIFKQKLISNLKGILQKRLIYQREDILDNS